MELKQLHQEIEEAYQRLSIDYKHSQLEELQKQMAAADFWSDQLNATKVSKQASSLETEVDTWRELRQSAEELAELAALEDESLTDDLDKRTAKLAKQFDKEKVALLFGGPYDKNDAILTIQAGAGGRDAADWAAMLLKMYSRWAEKKGYKSSLLDETTTDDGGIKSATLALSGSNVFGLLKGEHGVHRLVRKSPFNTAGSRETSFAMVEVLPQIDEPEAIELDENDLKIDVYRAGGSGGQSVNTTDSAVRVTHLPTGISVAIQNERSQLQNKETALKILRSRLAQMMMQQHQEKISALKGPNKEAAWGNQIRNYVLHPYNLVKDVRTNHETSDTAAVLDGAIDEFIEQYLKQQL